MAAAGEFAGAIAEGLALRLAHGGEGVRGLEGTILVELSAGGLVSGTGVRGALSERMRRLQFEVKRANGKIVLFIDNHQAKTSTRNISMGCKRSGCS